MPSHFLYTILFADGICKAKIRMFHFNYLRDLRDLKQNTDKSNLLRIKINFTKPKNKQLIQVPNLKTQFFVLIFNYLILILQYRLCLHSRILFLSVVSQ